MVRLIRTLNWFNRNCETILLVAGLIMSLLGLAVTRVPGIE